MLGITGKSTTGNRHLFPYGALLLQTTLQCNRIKIKGTSFDNITGFYGNSCLCMGLRNNSQSYIKRTWHCKFTTKLFSMQKQQNYFCIILSRIGSSKSSIV